jgi:phage terminase small subunit
VGKPALTPKQQAFVAEYLVDLNATQAAIRAGYKAKNAYQTGAENLRKPQIQKAIQEAREAREKATMYDTNWIMAQIARIAEDETQAARDRLKALELMGKRYGIWEKRQDEDTSVKVTFDGELEVWSE